MTLPLIVCAGEALTDLVTAGGNTWQAHPGGAAWNVARACARLGVPSAFAGAVGRDNFGADLYRETLEAGLDPRFIQQVDAPTLMAVVYSKNPPAYRFLGENSADLHFNPTHLPDGWLRSARWLHLGGISLARWPLADTLLGVMESARAAGVNISFDPNARITHRHPDYPTVMRAVIRQANLLKFSDEDLQFFFPQQTEEDIIHFLRDENASVPIVITRGADGATLYTTQRQDYPTYPVKVVDTVGAGDALCAGLLSSATQHPDQAWDKHLQVGLKAAACNCAHAGAYAPTPEDLQNI